MESVCGTSGEPIAPAPRRGSGADELSPGHEALRAARRCLIDWLGCALGGSREPAALATHRLFSDRHGSSTVWGREGGLAPRDAAFANGVAGHVLDLDDELEVMHGHPAAAIVPAALALAEAQDQSLGLLLRSLIRGYDTAAYLGALVNPGHYLAGWHATATLGAIAATDACGVLVGCAPEERDAMLSLAAVQASGLRAVFGTDAKALQVGNAASVAVTAATLSRTLSLGSLGAVGAYLSLVGTESVPFRASGIQSTMPPAIERTTFKWHAVCGAAHCVVEAVAGLVNQRSMEISSIEAMLIEVGPMTAKTACISWPGDAQQAQFSLPYLGALAAERHPIGYDDLWPPTDEVRRLSQRCRVRVVSDLPDPERHPARVSIVMARGRRFTSTVLAARGSAQWPLSDEEMSAKFIGLIERAYPGRAGHRLLAWLRQCPDSTPVSAVTRMIRDVIAG